MRRMRGLSLYGVAVLVCSSVAYAGALSPSGGVGTYDMGLGVQLEGLRFPHNVAGYTQIDDHFVEFVSEIRVPRFVFRDQFGRKQHSDHIGHLMPGLRIASRLDEHRVLSLSVKTPFAMGASFQNNFQQWGFDTKTLVSLTTATLGYSVEVTDDLSLGVGAVVGWGQLKWKAPFDIGRRPLPIPTDTEAEGFGVGFTVGLIYGVSEKLFFGLNYTSPLEVSLSGDTDISLGLFGITDSFKSEFKFPASWDIAFAYEASEKLLLTADFNWHQYSQAQQEVLIDFDVLPLTKPVNLGWGDVVSVHVALTYQATEHLALRAGAGMMTQGIPDYRVDTLTPDVFGQNVATGVTWTGKRWHLGGTYSMGWGSNDVADGFHEIQVHTFAVSGGISF